MLTADRIDRIRKAVRKRESLVRALSLVVGPQDRGIGDVASRMLVLAAKSRREAIARELRGLLDECGCHPEVASVELNKEKAKWGQRKSTRVSC